MSDSTCIKINSSDVVFDGGGNVIESDGSGDTGIEVTDASGPVSNVTVRNVTVTEWSNESIRVDAGDATTPAGVVVTNTEIRGPGGDGITVVDAGGVALRGNDIDKDADAHGTQVINSTDVLIEDDRLNDHEGPEFTNLYIDRSDQVTVRNVTVTDDESTVRSGAGVLAVRSTGVTVAESRITLDESGDAVQMRNSQSLKVVNNEFSKTGIIIRDSTDGVVRGNTVFGNRSGENGAIWGVNLDADSNITVENNRFDNHQLGVLFGYGSSDITVRNNLITDALDAGIFVARGASGTTINDNIVRVSAGSVVLETFNTSNVEVRNLDAGTLSGSGSTLSFTAENVTIRTVSSQPAPPSGQGDIGIYLNATNTGSNNFPDGTDKSYLDLTVEYREAAAGGVNESTLSLWRYDSDTDSWSDIGGTLDESANTVSKNITSYSVFAPLGNQTTSGGDDGDDGTPEITDYTATAEDDEITVSFDSDENLVDIEVEVRGPEDATLTREDFSGNRFDGYEATYRAGEGGTYTLELVTATDAGNNDGAEEETFSETVSVDSDNGTTANETATPTPTATDGDEPADGTPTDADEPADETPTDADDTDTPADETPTDADDETATTTQEDGPGFGPMLAVVALLAGAVLLARRR